MNNRHEYIISPEKLTFCIRNFSRAKPFSSFLPGIAGLNGIPMWIFYTNRGQGISSFGTENKDGAILEFQPANRAYNLTGLRGFRTFINWKRKKTSGFKEFFSSDSSETLMKIRPYELEIEETDLLSGFSANVAYFTVPSQPVAMFARIVTLSNTGRESAAIEMLDGIPGITCFGMNDAAMKSMSRTIEAWAFVENLDRNAPFFHIKALNEDKPEIMRVKRGNFFISFMDENGKGRLCKPVVNPQAVFGMSTDFIHPEIFASGKTSSSDPLMFVNRTPCTMGLSKFILEPGSSGSMFSIFGNSADLATLNALLERISSPGFLTAAREQNRSLVLDIADKCFVKSSSVAFDSYCGQNFVDNILRGGLPVSISSPKQDRKDVIHVYSRKHGDPERDYNSFQIMPTFYSQGNGNYRDINQNRRNDVYCNPDVLSSSIEYFLNLIQLDGFNPLAVRGVSYKFAASGENKKFLRKVSDRSGELFGFFRNNFIPYGLIDFINSKGIRLEIGLGSFISEILLRSEKTEEATHGEGYWIDHWFYNLDLLESFESVFPDRICDILLGMQLSFYDDCYCVQSRSRKYLLHESMGPAQLNSVAKIPAKEKLIKARKTEVNKVRTLLGKGEIYKTSLFGKLLILLVNKVSSLDANGVGIEMEAGKPSWNDALNGLPGMFGSCISETFELKRLAQCVKRYAGCLDGKDNSVSIPAEAFKFFSSVSKSLENNLESRDISDFEYWDTASYAREKFRDETKFGLKGQEKEVTKNYILLFAELCIVKAAKGIDRAFDNKSGLYNTYFINIPEKYDKFDIRIPEQEKLCKGIIVKKFKQIPLPPFLEGQVHGMRDLESIEKAALLCKAVRNSQLFDKELGMYRVNESLEKLPLEIGRLRTFTPGWLENESIFLHMEYKYLIEVLRKGLYEEFFRDVRKALVPFMVPETYGRSIFENSSFIASSANPDKSVHGNGFVARLSGSTSEFYNMLLLMTLGEKPFVLNGGQLELAIVPALPGWIFTAKREKVKIFTDGVEEVILIESGSFIFRCLGGTLFIFRNPSGKDVFGSARISKMVLSGHGAPAEIRGNIIPSPYSKMVRDGKIRRIDVHVC